MQEEGRGKRLESPNRREGLRGRSMVQEGRRTAKRSGGKRAPAETTAAYDADVARRKEAGEDEIPLEAWRRKDKERRKEAAEKRAHAQKAAVTYLVFDNPGRGKSTLQNCIAKAKLFEPGPSADGRGVTNAHKRIVHGDSVFVDVPGLSDPNFREKAAREVTCALRHGVRCKIIFICGEDHGRVVSDDKVTIRLGTGGRPESSDAIRGSSEPVRPIRDAKNRRTPRTAKCF